MITITWWPVQPVQPVINDIDVGVSRFSAPNGTYENASLELPAADTLGTHGTCLLLICLLILLTVLSDEDLQVMPTGEIFCICHDVVTSISCSWIPCMV